MIWSLPVLPGQDLPQHLAYARILLDYDRPDLPYHDLYLRPTHLEPYFVVYWFLGAVGRRWGLVAAFRLLMSLEVVATLVAFDALVRALRPAESRASWTGLLGGVLIWSPVACMGFLSFLVCVPLFLFACAGYARLLARSHARLALLAMLVCTAALSSLHIVAAGLFLLLVGLDALLNRDRRRLVWCLVIALTESVTLFAWSLWGGIGLGKSWHFELVESLRRTLGLDFVGSLFRMKWNDPLLKLTYAAWTVLGPFSASGLFVAAAGASTLAAIAVAERRRHSSPAGAAAQPQPWLRSALAFALLSWLMPWGLYVPTEITFLDLRAMTLACGLLFALVPAHWFASRRAQLALASFVLLQTGIFHVSAVRFSREAAPALKLERAAAPHGMMMSLVFHNRGSGFGSLFRVTHFLPMYYTILERGTNTQFWARYTDHLPVDYRANHRPANTADWNPERFALGDLHDSEYLLVQAATADDSSEVQRDYRRVEGMLRGKATTVGCDGLWCLYRRPAP